MSVGAETTFEGACRVEGGIDFSMSELSRLSFEPGSLLRAPDRMALDLTNAELLSTVSVGEKVAVAGTIRLAGANPRQPLPARYQPARARGQIPYCGAGSQPASLPSPGGSPSGSIYIPVSTYCQFGLNRCREIQNERHSQLRVVSGRTNTPALQAATDPRSCNRLEDVGGQSAASREMISAGGSWLGWQGGSTSRQSCYGT